MQDCTVAACIVLLLRIHTRSPTHRSFVFSSFIQQNNVGKMIDDAVLASQTYHEDQLECQALIGQVNANLDPLD